MSGVLGRGNSPLSIRQRVTLVLLVLLEILTVATTPAYNPGEPDA